MLWRDSNDAGFCRNSVGGVPSTTKSGCVLRAGKTIVHRPGCMDGVLFSWGDQLARSMASANTSRSNSIVGRNNAALPLVVAQEMLSAPTYRPSRLNRH